MIADHSISQRRKIWAAPAAVFFVALALRLLFVLALDTSPALEGGDANWYMEYGHDLVTTGTTAGPVQTAPLYLIVVGSVQTLTPGGSSGDAVYTYTEMQVIRILQAILGAGLCLFAAELARRTFSQGVGWITGFVLAISPTLIIEAGHLTTEGLFLFLLVGGLALYARGQPQPTVRLVAAVGVVLGLATLTRAILLLFPAAFVLHLFLNHRERWIRLSLALLLSFGLITSTWTVYNALHWHRFIIGGEGLLSFLYLGAEGPAAPADLDSELGITVEDDADDRHDALREGVVDSITSDPAGWAGHRVKELVRSYLQPHNTVYFGGQSVKDAAADWLRGDRSLAGLRDIISMPDFGYKLLLYAFHYGGLILGAAGMVLAWRRWFDLLPLYAVPLYFTAIHLVLLALPRYLFPLYPVLWVFGSAVIVQSWDRFRRQPEHGQRHALFRR
ncbi:MAG: glycosyltransferase family 39 protein [Anaerolineae bacterium]|nr:glycosyltransferase family 39 protein [Anaerolineae bacterium]